MNEPELTALSEKIIGAAIEVHRALGPGFQEITYHRALLIEMEEVGLAVETEVPVELRYKGRVIGEGRIDLLVEGKLVVELKAAAANPQKYRRQVIAYLKATNKKLGLIINFEADRLVDGITRVIN
ncbi:MAG: GxxExxY protein [Phycisphaeraceae bacterium]